MSSVAHSTSRQQPLAASYPATLDASAIEQALATVASDGGGGWHVTVVATTGSTNSDLLRSIRDDGFVLPALLVAEHQTAGRGRLGRTWASSADASLTASFALRIERPMAALDGVTLVCGLAVRDAIASHGVEARLKWPNDLLVEGKKLGGILVETAPVAAATVLVVGVGINVQDGGEVVDRGGRGLPATDLRTAGGYTLDRNRLVAEVAVALRTRLATFAIRGFASTVDEWNRHDAFRDRQVSLRTGDAEAVTGIARGVDGGGALLIDTPADRRRIVSGDLSLRLAERP